MSEKKKRHSGNANSQESFKEQILRTLHEGSGTGAPVYAKEKRTVNAQSKQKKQPTHPPKKKGTQPSKEKKDLPNSAAKRKNAVSSKPVVKNQSSPKREETLPPPQRRANSSKRSARGLSTEKKADKMVFRIVLVVATTVVIILGIVGFSFYDYIERSLQPYNEKDNTYVDINIPIGSSNKQIGAILQQDKIIRNAMVFNYFTKFKNLSNFQGGHYNMKPSMTLEEIAKMLQQGGTAKAQEPVIGKILIPEGYTLQQIAKAFEVNANSKSKEKTPFQSKEFLELMQSEEFFNEMKEKYPDLLTSAAKAKGVKYRLEGYLFPATYDYTEKSTIKSIVETMIATMDQTLSDKYPAIKAKGMTVQEVLAIASYVEKEGATEADRRNIAQVFYNRMKEEMPLQTNISILYAEGKLGEKITAEDDKQIDTKIKSPYNLYVHKGIGPGPVDSPSLMSIEAVLDPKKNDYLYFLADVKTGKVYFSTTYDEHEALVAKYLG